MPARPTPDPASEPDSDPPPSKPRRRPARSTAMPKEKDPKPTTAEAADDGDTRAAAEEPAADGDATGVTKPWRDDAPDPKKTAKIAQKAAQLAEQDVADDQDKAAVEAPRPVVDAKGLRVAIGVDVGRAGIKAAAVDLGTGELSSPRHRVATPPPSA